MAPEQFQGVLTAAVEGADWAWADLYHEYAGRLTGYARIRGAADPDDLAGAVFLHVARRIEDFDGDEAAFRAWLFAVAHDRVIDERRRTGRRPAKSIDRPASPRGSASTEAEEPSLEGIDVESMLRVFDGLTDDQRNILLLRIVAGMSLAEIAATMNKRLRAVTQLQARALAAMRQELETASKTT